MSQMKDPGLQRRDVLEPWIKDLYIAIALVLREHRYTMASQFERVEESALATQCCGLRDKANKRAELRLAHWEESSEARMTRHRPDTGRSGKARLIGPAEGGHRHGYRSFEATGW